MMLYSTLGITGFKFSARVLATGKVKFVLNSRENPIGGRLGFSHMALASWGAADNSGGARGQVAPWRKGRSTLIIVTHTYSHKLKSKVSHKVT